MTVARIAVVAGDGIGTEVVAQAPQGSRRRAARRRATSTTTSAPRRYHRTGEVLPDSVRDELAGHDAILLGAVGDPTVPPGVLERGLLLKLRFDFDQYVNLRPSRLWPGTASPLAGVKPGEIDLVVVREGTEGLYAGAGGVLHQGTAGRGRHRGEPEHPARRRAGHPRRVRPGRPPRAAQGDAGPQDQRAHPRRRALGPHVRRRSPPSSPTSPPNTSTSTRRRCSW